MSPKHSRSWAGGARGCPHKALEQAVRTDGPAVIEELTWTTVVHPNHVARVDELLNLVVEAC